MIALCQVDLGCHPLSISEIFPVDLLFAYCHHVEGGLVVTRAVGVLASLIDFDVSLQNDKAVPVPGRRDGLIAYDLDDLFVIGYEAVRVEIVRIRLSVKGVFGPDLLYRAAIPGVTAGPVRYLAATEPGVGFVGKLSTTSSSSLSVSVAPPVPDGASSPVVSPGSPSSFPVRSPHATITSAQMKIRKVVFIRTIGPSF